MTEWIGASAPGEGFLFVQDGKPPEPVWEPRGARFGGELRVVYSYKLERNFTLCWSLEWKLFLLLDCDPLVKWICARPAKVNAKIDGKKTSATYDMWILWMDGSEMLVEVKPEENVETSARQITLQEQWAELIGIKHRVATEKKLDREPLIDNISRMHPYLSQHPGANWERTVLAHVDHTSPFPLMALQGTIPLETQKLLHAAIHLLWRGILVAPLDSTPWEKLTLRRFEKNEQRTPYCGFS